MSLVGANGLNAAVNEHQKGNPNRILDDLNNFSYLSLNKDSDEVIVKDDVFVTAAFVSIAQHGHRSPPYCNKAQMQLTVCSVPL